MPFLVMFDLIRTWPFGPIACHFWISCDVMCCTASILHLCAVAIDRYSSLVSLFSKFLVIVFILPRQTYFYVHVSVNMILSLHILCSTNDSCLWWHKMVHTLQVKLHIISLFVHNFLIKGIVDVLFIMESVIMLIWTECFRSLCTIECSSSTTTMKQPQLHEKGKLIVSCFLLTTAFCLSVCCSFFLQILGNNETSEISITREQEKTLHRDHYHLVDIGHYFFCSHLLRLVSWRFCLGWHTCHRPNDWLLTQGQ